jgi:DNA-binding MarR family transcriptional regulator
MRAARDLQVVIGRLVRRLRAENTFPISQAIVLGRLAREGSSTTSALAAAERVRPQSMAQTIAELEASGLVERRPDPSDRRQILIELTDGGKETLDRDRLRRAGWLAAAMTTCLSPEEQVILAQAIPLLDRLAEA